MSNLALVLVLAIQPFGSVDSLRQRLAALEAAADSAEHANRQTDRLTPVVAGRLTAELTADRVDFARPVLNAANLEWERLYRPGRAPAVWLRIRPLSGWMNVATGRVNVAVEVRPDSAAPPVASVTIDPDFGELEAAVWRRALWEALGALLLHRSDSTGRQWLASPPALAGNAASPDDVRYLLATVRDSSAQQCFQGQLPACPVALGLDPATKREVPPAVRHAFLASVLRRGGEGALERLETDGSLTFRPRLERAGGAPFDSLVVGWLAEVRAQAAPSTEPRRAVLGLVWAAAAFAVLLVIGVRS